MMIIIIKVGISILIGFFAGPAVVYFFKTKDTMIIGIYENKIKKLFKRKA